MTDGRYLVYRSGRSDWDSWNNQVVRVWREGPKGGVKVIRDNSYFDTYGYITTKKNAMKDFMWAKLAAKESKFVTT
jgi:predicted phosphoadenosine phosphosulfate sulfurtransferase